MHSKLRWLIAFAALVVSALALAACGDDDSDSDSSAGGAASGIPPEFEAPTAAPDGAQEGGELTVLATDDIDYMDPGAAYYQFTYMVTSAGHRALLSWKPDDVEEPSPDLAEDFPEISEDGKTITFTIREGVKFSPPVDRDVTSEDVKYAIERAILPGVANGYASAYLGDIVGFAAAEKEATDNPTGGAPDIEGITTPDPQTLQIELERPTSATVVQALSLPISAPVPEEYAKEFDAENPSTYGNHVVFTGPYMVENDPKTGELTGYTPGREITMVRNPNWDAESDFRPAYLDTIQIEEGFADTASASRRILEGDGQVNGDITPPPTVQKEAAQQAEEEGQIVASPSGGNRYIALNTQEPPFDDLDVRKAVLAASDRTAMRNTRGGEIVGPVATHFIPPGIPGFEEAGGIEGEGQDFLATPEGDMEVAEKYMQAAGYESGQCEGSDCEVTVVGDGALPDRDTTDVFVDALEQLGFSVNEQGVARDVMYTRFCGTPDSAPNVCPSVGWLKDFQDPQSILQPTFNGEEIQSTNNVNWPQLDVPEINKAMDEAALIVNPAERAQAWGDIDTQITEQAAAVPYVWDNQVNIRSADVAGVINLFNANWDLAYTSVESP